VFEPCDRESKFEPCGGGGWWRGQDLLYSTSTWATPHVTLNPQTTFLSHQSTTHNTLMKKVDPYVTGGVVRAGSAVQALPDGVALVRQLQHHRCPAGGRQVSRGRQTAGHQVLPLLQVHPCPSICPSNRYIPAHPSGTFLQVYPCPSIRSTSLQLPDLERDGMR
jgi:hypothetical protein